MPSNSVPSASYLRLAFAVVAICAVTIALWSLRQEYAAFRLTKLEPRDWYMGIRAPAPPRPLSVEGHYAILSACDRALADPIADVMPLERRVLVARACAAAARRTLAQSPNFALAHLVRASASTVEGDDAATTAALLRAEAGAPGLTWMAARRFDLARQLAHPDAALLAREIKRLAQSDLDDARKLSRRYLATPSERVRVLAVVSELHVDAQAQFLSAVEELLDP
ncbi:MAG: hypothetical protein AAF330_04565 [Pseudomonadota bacterium]